MSNTAHNKARKVIVITSGEPAGIGPDLIILLHKHLSKAGTDTEQNTDFLILADPNLLEQRANLLNKKINIRCVQATEIQTPFPNNTLNVLPISCLAPVSAGKLNKNNSAYVMHMLDTAISLCQQEIGAAIVTCPIQKSILLDAGFQLQGHTEYLAQQCHTEKVVMMLANPLLRVALITTHLPLKEVSAAITQKDIIQCIQIIDHDLRQKFSISKPKIFVCGLNPHAGEEGHLGKEEITTIIPALNLLRAQGIDIVGPLPADTIFSKSNREQADAFVAMYHDQGLPVLKALGFGDSINITLGLPIIRTSVDHGTALELAGTGNINTQSFMHALDTAALLIHSTTTDK